MDNLKNIILIILIILVILVIFLLLGKIKMLSKIKMLQTQIEEHQYHIKNLAFFPPFALYYDFLRSSSSRSLENLR